MVLRMRRDLAALWLAWLAAMLLHWRNDCEMVSPFALPRQ